MHDAADRRFNKRFGGLLAAARDRHGLSQHGLGELIGLDQAAVSRVERGERRLSLPEFFRWCHALGVAPDDLCKQAWELWSPAASQSIWERERS